MIGSIRLQNLVTRLNDDGMTDAEQNNADYDDYAHYVAPDEHDIPEMPLMRVLRGADVAAGS